MGALDKVVNAVGAELLQLRWVVRMPIPLYRHGLGWVFGSRILMLEMRGRASGRTRYVAVECVMRPGPRTVVIVSGFGQRSQWYRNLQADPQVRVSIGRIRSRKATAILLSRQESAELLRQFSEERGDELRHLVEIIARARPGEKVDLRAVRLELDDPTGTV
ncbi:MAG: nitroreductase family deazaflavin-dependent oxidoreductase [Jatrophihabitantaceae bacterium]